MIRRERLVDGALLLYHHPPVEGAPTVMEHVESFARHSRFPVYAVNTDAQWLGALRHLRFRIVVLHYSLFGGDVYLIPPAYERFLDRHRDAYKVAFFQDEHRYCQKRFEFLNRHRIDAVYSCLDPAWVGSVYGRFTAVPTLHSTLTGYVSDDLVERARELSLPDAARTIGIGYRGRPLPFWMGRGAQEKREIAERFVDRALDLDLRVDIATTEASRIYGDAWYRFVANCRGMLGVEAGTSVFDLDDSARERTEALLEHEPDLNFDEVEHRVLREYEGKIPYRTISPRHFEAAAFRVVQILYEGRYSGVMDQDVHYLALKKDFSNFDEVMTRFADPEVRQTMTDRAYDDLIASGRYSYAGFVRTIDHDLEASVVLIGRAAEGDPRLVRRLRRWESVGQVVNHPLRITMNAHFPGRSTAAHLYHWLQRHD